jgi:hypothetical protein
MPENPSTGPSPKDDLIDQLHELIVSLTMKSMEPQYSTKEQNLFFDYAKKIRTKRIALRKVEFDKKTDGYREAAESLQKVNGQIREAIDKISHLIQFWGDLSSLVSFLDKIVKVVSVVI